jgi:K+/H+ antiporter YhaU regulatory subunit KhtT
MIGIISLLVILVLSVLITRIATVALTHTGLSRSSAKFQARSAITGVGFTTAESEKVVNHPLRRRILLALMLLGNAGIITAISSLIIGFVDRSGGSSLRLRVIILAAGITGLWMLTTSSYLESRLANIISWIMGKSSSVEVYDFSSMLHLAGEYRISEIGISGDHWLCGRTLSESGLRQEGLVVLGITRADGTYIGSPQPDTRIKKDNTLILYGRTKSIRKLKKRKEGELGNLEHEESKRDQDEEIRKEEREDEESERHQ